MSFECVTISGVENVLRIPGILIVDLRPHAAYSSARIINACSLSVPSTLLKRPLFSIEKLSAMLPALSRQRLRAFPTAAAILIYDADTASLSESGNVYRLSRKFRNEGFHGRLFWLQGGLQVLSRDRSDLIDTSPPDDDDDELANRSPSSPSSPSSPCSPSSPSVLRTRALPRAAFSQSSLLMPSLSCASVGKHSTPAPPSDQRLPSLSMPLATQTHTASNPFFDTIRQNAELSQHITESIPLRLPRHVRKRMHDLPFAWLKTIARHSTTTAVSPSSDDGIDPADVEEGAQALAMQFYNIELAEQRRLMAVMEYHTKESGYITQGQAGGSSGVTPFPFSIIAGVEKGAQNRYRHIWPFEHARVRLHQKTSGNSYTSPDDYVNASYVQPLGTRRRYIATQGPLPATFTDFWTLCWEQNVYIIVMLTREVEGEMTKCGNYWSEQVYGSLRLELVSTSSHPSCAHISPSSPSSASPPPASTLPTTINTIKRVFHLSHRSYPKAGARTIVHLQYLAWPDMHVPLDAAGVLGLRWDVERAYRECAGEEDSGSGDESEDDKLDELGVVDLETRVDPDTGIAIHAASGRSRAPVLLHCSAGVGRTGGFIAVDAVLDAIRREVRREKRPAKARGDAGGIRTADINVQIHVSSADDPSHSGDPTSLRGKGHDKDAPTGLSSDGTLEMEAVDADDRPTSITQKSSATRWAGTVSVSSSCSSSPPSPLSGGSDGVAPANRTRSSPSSSSGRASALGSDDSSMSGFNWLRGQFSSTTSSARTSVSGSAKFTGRMGTSKSAPRHGLSRGSQQSSVDVGHGKVALRPTFDSWSNTEKTESDGPMDYRARTFSAPCASVRESSPGAKHFTSRNVIFGDSELTGPGVEGIGFSPLASASTSQLVSTDETAFAPGMSSSAGVKRTSSLGMKGDRERRRQFQSLSQWLRAKSRSPAPCSKRKRVSETGRSSVPVTAAASNSGASSGSGCDTDGAPKRVPANIIVPTQALVMSPLSIPGTGAAATTTLTPAVPLSTTSPSSAPSATTSAVALMNIDLKPPRRLHDDRRPALLSTYSDPVSQVVQDMREQRMSLCQSLRQYVFVHAAIVEGALMIVDEERELAAAKSREDQRIGEPSLEGRPTDEDGDVLMSTVHPIGSPETEVVDLDRISSTPSLSTGKRLASPHELSKEGSKRGAFASRKQSSMDRSSSPAFGGITASRE